MTPFDLAAVLRVYDGSDGDATKALYAALEQCGPGGSVAMNVFRAAKCSARAKVYRGGARGRGSYRSMAYDRKEWSIGNLSAILLAQAESLGIRWGWAHDPAQPVHCWLLYVDLPTGQVSFHVGKRGDGPDYQAAWDGIRDAAPGRICRWCVQLLEIDPAAAASCRSRLEAPLCP